jgi:hypothetical protein
MHLDSCCISATLTLSKQFLLLALTLVKYVTILGANSADSKKVFTLQKKIIRIMVGVKSHNSFRDLLKRLQIITFNLITDNKELFQMNADVHSVNTRYKNCIHKPIANVSCLKKSKFLYVAWIMSLIFFILFSPFKTFIT